MGPRLAVKSAPRRPSTQSWKGPPLTLRAPTQTAPDSFFSEVVDEAEELARERAKRLFGCEFVNVQPHSGSQANQAVFMATMVPGDTFMGMNLDHGGHLTHGKSVNQSGKWFRPVSYGVRRQDHLIDYDEAAEVARAERPKVIIAGGSAYSRAIDFARFREISDEVGAILMCDIAHYAGLVAAGVYPNPFPHAH